MTDGITSADTLFDLITGHRVTAMIAVAAELGLADVLQHGPQTAAALATATGADPGALRRLLRGLMAFGLLRQVASDSFALTDIGRHLAADHPGSLKAWALFEGTMLRRSWERFADTVRAGKTAAQLAGAASSFDLMSGDPTAIAIFNGAMADLTRLVAVDVLSAHDFSGIDRLMDVGGGIGELLTAILTAHPRMHGIVFDLPRCADAAARQFAAAGVADRAAFIRGSFFEHIPSGADAILLKSTIHDWDDKNAIDILRRCHDALPPRGPLLLIERLLADASADDPTFRANVLSDLNMLRGPGGSERTQMQFERLLSSAGFRLRSVAPAGRFAVMEAIPA